MGLAATKIGTGMPTQPFAGVVRSVFVNSAILSVGSSLLTLVPDAAGGLPFGISVDVPSGFDFTRYLTVGDSLAARAGVLRLAGGTSVDLRGAHPWRARLDGISVDLANPATVGAWHTVAAALRDDGRSGAIAGLAPSALCLLSDATRCFDLMSAGQAAERLVGLGAGGTPAGDDVLVGFLTGVWSSAARDPRRGNFGVGIGELLRSLAKRTNDVSRTYLEAATTGEVSERLSDVALCIATGAATSAALTAARRAMSVGHTSGSDGTLGLLLALAAWGPEPIFAASRRLVEATPAKSA